MPKLFNKHILLIDLETTGLDANKHDVIQIGAVLLHKDTLKEIKSFSSLVKPSRFAGWDPKAMRINKINKSALRVAPPAKLVLKQVLSLAKPESVILASYGSSLDDNFLRMAFKKAGLKFSYDYHNLNLWPIFYLYCAKHGLLSKGSDLGQRGFAGFSLDSLAKHFKIGLINSHDALEDAKLEAEIFRKIIQSYGK